MQMISGIREFQSVFTSARPVCVAIGNFDGVHLGHQALFQRAAARARALGGSALVLTFDPHPAKLLAPERAPKLLMALSDRLGRISEVVDGEGRPLIDCVIVEPFTAKLAAYSPREFCEQLLVEALGVKAVVVGHDFTFGRGRQGNGQTLAELGREFGFSCDIVEAVQLGGDIVSSTKIRSFLQAGEIEAAARLLGRPPRVSGPVVRGAGRGKTIGVPTANCACIEEQLPKLGVYAARAVLTDGTAFPAAVNIGKNPTFVENSGASPISVEAHLIGLHRDIYGARLMLDLVTRIRDERRFESIDSLVAQIRLDIEAAARAVRAEDEAK